MKSSITLKIADGTEASVKVASFEGEMDESNLDSIKNQLNAIKENNAVKKLILDFEKLEFINSKGIGYLVSLHTHMTKGGRHLVIAGGTEPVMDVISLVGLTQIIPHFDSVESAEKN